MEKSITKRNLIGPRVMQERQRQGLSRKSVCGEMEAYNVKMSPRTLSSLERQKRPAFDKEMCALSKVLKVSLDWLLGRDA